MIALFQSTGIVKLSAIDGAQGTRGHWYIDPDGHLHRTYQGARATLRKWHQTPR
jgi:hypothetical protein